MFFRQRPVLILVTTVAIGVAVAIGYTSRKRRPRAAPEQPIGAMEPAIQFEPLTIDGTALPVPHVRPPLVRTHSLDYAMNDGWYLRSDALRQQCLRKLSEALFKAG